MMFLKPVQHFIICVTGDVESYSRKSEPAEKFDKQESKTNGNGDNQEEGAKGLYVTSLIHSAAGSGIIFSCNCFRM
jgi:hypothetical protein